MKSFTVLCLAVLMTGCNLSGLGGGPWSQKLEARFINKGNFKLTEAEFQSLMEARWKMAQQSVATETQYNLDGSKLSDPDPRALTIEPQNVTVKSQPDIPASVINALPNLKYGPYTDPTGFIYCPPNSAGAKYCNAWMDNLCTVVVPDGHPEYVGPYEFSNCVLYALGKDVGGR